MSYSLRLNLKFEITGDSEQDFSVVYYASKYEDIKCYQWVDIMQIKMLKYKWIILKVCFWLERITLLSSSFSLFSDLHVLLLYTPSPCPQPFQVDSVFSFEYCHTTHNTHSQTHTNTHVCICTNVYECNLLNLFFVLFCVYMWFQG